MAGGTCRDEGRSAASARQGRTTKAMPKHRRGVLTPYGAATPLCPSGFACASLGGLAEVHQEPAIRQAARLSGTGPSASLGLLDVALGYAFTCASLGGLAGQRQVVAAWVAARLGTPPPIWPRGACNAARPTSATPF
jgi:hypothetical protein